MPPLSGDNKESVNVESILHQFKIIEQSIKRAKLPLEVGLLSEENLEVVLYECLKSREQLYNIVLEIGHPKLPKTISCSVDLSIDDLNLCPYCGNPNCQSDHK